ncbi:kinase-like domain-containing protein [Mycena alexandri]|uniref:Kinase-like domain-containing protein n=1 Tax=Mycena alexandri TaxID=1745969 RepID=A0AAD6T512_9AGAR|nr:kinase-like domain-containing protein [Mycena alexandri]
MSDDDFPEITTAHSALESHLNSELFWIELQPFLLSRGYLLRPRFRPGWVPPWTLPGAGRPLEYEDVIHEARPNVLDAVRVSDGTKVVLKRVRTWTSEIPLGVYFNRDLEDPHNHTYRLLDIIPLANDDDFALIVMPFLRGFGSPIFRSVDEVAEAMRQFLQGIEYMHRHNVAHRDACELNLMMDATNVIPQGFHFSRPWTRDGVDYGIEWRARSSVLPVDYFIVDFGLSEYFPEGPQHARAVGKFGQDKTVPELSATVPYNPFKVDIYQLGNVFSDLNKKYPPLADHFGTFAALMTRPNPEERPTAGQALSTFEAIYSSLSPADLAERLYLRSPPSPSGSSVLSGEDDSEFELVSVSGCSDSDSLNHGSSDHGPQESDDNISKDVESLDISPD